MKDDLTADILEAIDDTGFPYDEPVDSCARERIRKLTTIVGFLASKLSAADQAELAEMLR